MSDVVPLPVDVGADADSVWSDHDRVQVDWHARQCDNDSIASLRPPDFDAASFGEAPVMAERASCSENRFNDMMPMERFNFDQDCSDSMVVGNATAATSSLNPTLWHDGDFAAVIAADIRRSVQQGQVRQSPIWFHIWFGRFTSPVDDLLNSLSN